MSPWKALLFFALGTLVGRALNVWSYRLRPQAMLNSALSLSCPICVNLLKASGPFPVLGFLLLKGRCRQCGQRLPWRDPIVEISAGLLFASLAVSSSLNLRTAVLLIFLSAIIGASLTDIDQRIIPDSITLGGTLFGLAASALIQDPPFLYAALGVVTGGGLILLMALVGRIIKGRETIGGGDIKLAAMLGAFLGWRQTVVAIVLGLFAGSVLAITLIGCDRKSWGEPLPFGPFLALGGVAALFWGNNLFDWYLYFFRK